MAKNSMTKEGGLVADMMPKTNMGSESGYVGRMMNGVCNKSNTGMAGRAVGLDIGYQGPVIRSGAPKRM